jgi:hypothetical protein
LILLRALFQHVENVCPAVATARRTYLPKIIGRHVLEVGPRCAKLRTMEDGLAADQLREDVGKRGVGDQVWLAGGIHCRLLI